MALLNKKLVEHEEVFYQKRRKDLIKIFKKLRKDKYITDFSVMPTIKNTKVICISFHIICNTEATKLHLFKSGHSDFLKIVKENSHEIEFLVGVDKKAKNIATVLKERIAKMAFGIKIELRFLNHVGKIQTDKFTLEKSNIYDDKKGIDFWIHFNELKVPLQIKTSHYSVIEHKKKFPSIPTLFYFPDKFSDIELHKALYEICNDFIKGKITHKC